MAKNVSLKKLLTYGLVFALIGAGLGLRSVKGQAAEGDLRIISLYAAHTENLLRMGARDNLVGISAQETYAGPETKNWARPPVFLARDDVEKYLAAKPDLILMRPQHLSSSPELWAALERSGVKIWAKQVLEAKELYAYWRDLGELANRQKEAALMTKGFQEVINQKANKHPGPRPGVFLEAIHKELKTFTPDSLPVWLLELAGGRNVATDVASGQGRIVVDFGPERLLAIAGEVDIYISQEGPMNRVDLSAIKCRSILRDLPAFKNNRVYKIPEELISRPTPGVTEGLDQLIEIINSPR
ncbi:MAG: ABC transporter substrate-binding protein [Deltaproteobacteria bacterium]|jgi:iron complex transport system substrate-binding protein|nr:ABC transporter substrate-binding protein [Deltaproteobacteria bacterium]